MAYFSLKKSLSLKSNVDVYLATDMLSLVYTCKKKTHIVLESCDGDYTEMIKTALDANPRVLITVLGTPVVRNNTNTFSVRLQALRGMECFAIMNVQTIKDKIS